MPNTITNILRRKEVGYKIGNRKVSNLLYIDDLKIYAKSDTQMKRCKAVVEEFSKDIKMDFGINKCAVIHVKKGQIIDSPIIDKIPRMTTSDSYKYLGIAQANTILHEKTKNKTKKEFYNRVRGILKKEANEKYTSAAMKIDTKIWIRYIEMDTRRTRDNGPENKEIIAPV